MGKPLLYLSGVILAHMPSGAGRTLPDTDLSLLALKVKRHQGLKF